MNPQVVWKDIKSQHCVGIFTFLSNGDDRVAGGGIGINIGEDYISGSLYCHLIPFGAFIVKGCIPFPWIGGNQLAVENCIGVYCTGPQDCLHLLIESTDPAFNILVGFFQFLLGIDGIGTEGNQRFKYRQITGFLCNITFGQSGAQFLRITQQCIL